MAGVAKAATKVEDVPVVLQQLELLHSRGSAVTIYQRIKSHYMQQWLVVVSRSLGSLNMLGNPLGLVTSLYSGVSDMIKEPAKELQSGLLAGRLADWQALARGLKRGSLSLLRHSVVGWCNTITKSTASAARFVAYLSMDHGFAAELSKALEDRQDPHEIGLVPGFLLGVGSLASVPSVAFQHAWRSPSQSGWSWYRQSDVLRRPSDASRALWQTDSSVILPDSRLLAAEDRPGPTSSSVTVLHRASAALPALVQGCVVAVVGLLAKPVAGLLDSVSHTSSWFEHAALSCLGPHAPPRFSHHRVRPPRPFGTDKVFLFAARNSLCVHFAYFAAWPCQDVDVSAIKNEVTDNVKLWLWSQALKELVFKQSHASLLLSKVERGQLALGGAIDVLELCSGGQLVLTPIYIICLDPVRPRQALWKVAMRHVISVHIASEQDRASMCEMIQLAMARHRQRFSGDSLDMAEDDSLLYGPNAQGVLVVITCVKHGGSQLQSAMAVPLQHDQTGVYRSDVASHVRVISAGAVESYVVVCASFRAAQRLERTLNRECFQLYDPGMPLSA